MPSDLGFSPKPASDISGLLSPFAQPGPQWSAAPFDWHDVWRFSVFHGVRPSLLRVVGNLSQSQDVPASLREELEDFARRHAFSILHKTGAIVSLSNAIKSAGISALFFKGALLAEQVYGGAQFREFNDIDILVDPARLDEAEDVLEGMGYLPLIPDRRMRRVFFNYMGQHVFRHHVTGLVVDLHWQFVGNSHFPVSVTEALENRVGLAVGGAIVPVPCVDDSALILAGHGQKEGWASFGWALDFATFAAAFPDFDWRNAARRAEARGTLEAVLTALLLVERLFGCALDEELAMLARRQARIDKSVDEIIRGYHALTLRKIEDDLMGAFRLCETRMQRARVWWGLLSNRTIGDYKSLPLPPEFWWIYHLMRPFRLALRQISDRTTMQLHDLVEDTRP